MIDPTAPSDQLLSLDELPPGPEVVLRGPGRMAPNVSTTAAVDGVGIIFFDPTTANPYLVFVSEGMAALVGSGVDELLGHSPRVIFLDTEADAELADMCRALGIGPADIGPIHTRPFTAAPDPLADSLAGPEVDVEPESNVEPEFNVEPEIEAATDTDIDSEAEPEQSLNSIAAPVVAIEPISDSNEDEAPLFPAVTGEFDAPLAIDLDALADQVERADIRIGDRHGGHGGHGDSEASDAWLSDDDGQDEGGPISRLYTTTQTLRCRDGEPVLVHATYTTVPSMTPAAPYVVVQFRDLGRAAAESLLADQAAVVGSLSRGHELGRLCHQVADQVEGEIGDGSRCWLGVVNAEDMLEPVISGDMQFDDVAEILRIVAGSGTESMKRVVSADRLPERFTSLLTQRGVKSLWYVPMLGAGGKVRGALMVATPKERPDQAITRSLDHLGAVMAAAVEHATAEADIAHQTLHDSLTHLPNRALIVDRLGQAMARLERDGIALSVLLVDIDRFRTVNDTRGVEVGDQVLLEVAARLLAAVRLGDTVGRISSDQYLVMCVATSGELDAAAVGRRILRSLSEPINVTDGDPLHITASVGVVVIDEPGASPATIISNAESALARASASGRGQMAMFEADLRRHVIDRHETEQALHRAITHEELVIHYQPLVEIRTGFIIGAEALVRWDRPGHGFLYPPSFIQIAEESELIVPMGNWIIDKVCSDLGRWPKANGRSPVVTINLAARQLAVDTLVPTVVSALQRNGLSPARVGFEITESMEIRDLDAAGTNLNRLSDLGCRIAIDDFGIGHATLDYIREFSMADALKIDRSFVAGLGNSKEDTAIVNASIALAESLELQVIAEGVENGDQLAALRDLGCRYAQGFGLARPVPFDEVLELWGRARLYEPVRL